MRSRCRGFSLIEAVITLFVVFLVLGVAMDMLNQYCAAVNFSAAKTSSLTTIQTALQSMIDDVHQSTQIESPLAGGQSQDLKLLMVDPSRLNDPGLSQDVIEVHYYMSPGNVYPSSSLLRDSTPQGGITTTWEVAQSVAALNVSSVASWPLQTSGGANAVQIQLSLQETTRILVINGAAQRWSF